MRIGIIFASPPEAGKEYYKNLFSKKEKIKLEETKNQEEIERKLSEKLELVDLNL
ncbi:MAG: hypothetical protein ABIE43_01335 [Patescibacteria group bacterium]